MIRTSNLAALCLMAGATMASASEFEPALREMSATRLPALLADPAIAAAIVAQNADTAGLAEDAIVSMDTQWRSEVGTASSPTVDGVMTAPLSDALRAIRDESGGLFTEIFVMDAVGLNVAASDVTSDYWQGDEAKWQETYAVGPGAVHISDVEFDESTQMYQAQVSMTVVDASGAPVGAATFGVNVEMLF